MLVEKAMRYGIALTLYTVRPLFITALHLASKEFGADEHALRHLDVFQVARHSETESTRHHRAMHLGPAVGSNIESVICNLSRRRSPV